jgi:pyrimidine operon attenuation protein / uracil phosphoribosyltransferase
MRFKAEVLTEIEIDKALKRLSHEIIENCDLSNVVLVGIKTRGVPLSETIAANIKKFADTEVLTGQIDISLYRDDLTTVNDNAVLNQTDFGFPIQGKDIILVDDVIFTGRTIRAAIEGIFSKGRPNRIMLAVLVDRGHRELPIRGDFIGKNIPTSKKELIAVNLKSIDGKTNVELWDKE